MDGRGGLQRPVGGVSRSRANTIGGSQLQWYRGHRVVERLRLAAKALVTHPSATTEGAQSSAADTSPPTPFSPPAVPTFSCGRYTYGQENIAIQQWGEGTKLSVGSFCSIASNVTVLLGGNHRWDWATTFPFGHKFVEELGGAGIVGMPYSNGDVVIENDVWIGHGVTIMSGVTIASGAVVATNSHVTRSVGPYEIVGGNPAKLIRKRFDDDLIAALLELRWWDAPVPFIRDHAADLSKVPTLDHITNLSKALQAQT